MYVGLTVLLTNQSDLVGTESCNRTIGFKFLVFFENEDEELRVELEEVISVVIDLFKLLIDEIVDTLLLYILHSENAGKVEQVEKTVLL
jgi:hypothetical protein